MERIFNFRPIVFVCLSLLMAIILSAVDNVWVAITTASLVFILLIILLVLYLIKRLKVNVFLFFIIIFSCFLIGFASTSSRIYKIKDFEKCMANQQLFSTEIKSVTIKESYILIKTDNVVVDGKKYDCSLYLRYGGQLYSSDSFSYGSEITLNKDINYTFKNLLESGDVVGNCYIDDLDIVKIAEPKGVFAKIRNYI